MSEPLTSEELERLEQIIAKATPGPWLTRSFQTWSHARPQLWVMDSIPDRDGKVVANAVCSTTPTNADAESNAAFIAAARAALPRLIEEVKELRRTRT